MRRLHWQIGLLSFCVAAPCIAQIPDEPSNAYLDVNVSNEARNRLRLVESHIRQEQWEIGRAHV